MDFIQGILLNMGLLMGFLFITNFSHYTTNDKSLRDKIIKGILIGVLVIIINMNAVEIQSSVYYDTRTVIFCVVALLLPIESSLIAAVMLIAYKFFVGTEYIYVHILLTIACILVGKLWRIFVYRKLKLPLILEWYIFGLVSHMIVLLPHFALPYPLSIQTLQQVWWPILLFYPVFVMIVGYTIVKHDESINVQHKLAQSESQYRTLFNDNPLAMFQCDNDGIIRIANEKFLTLLEVDINTVIGTNINLISNQRVLSCLHEALSGKTTIYEGEYISYYSRVKLFVRIQFSPLMVDGKMDGIVGIAEDLTMMMEANKELDKLRKTDLLTRLLNRRSFDYDLEKRRSNKHLPTTIGILDINTFQVINESFSYSVGNDVLIAIGNILEGYGNKSVKVYRIGGDEFALIMNKTTNSQGQAIMNEIKHRINNIDQFDFQISVSVGYSTYNNLNTIIDDTYTQALTNMHNNKIYDSSSISKKTIDIIMSTLFDKSKRELKHSERVGEISAKIAREMNLGTAFYNKTALAGKLHDIGKINISHEILDKPSRLDDEEWLKIKKHPESGFKILSSVPEYLEIAGIVLAHHERFDGLGYPNQIKGHDIPLPSRIICVADSYDAMTEERPYRNAFTKEEAIQELKRCSGTQFDPEIVELFLKKVVNKI